MEWRSLARRSVVPRRHLHASCAPQAPAALGIPHGPWLQAPVAHHNGSAGFVVKALREFDHKHSAWGNAARAMLRGERTMRKPDAGAAGGGREAGGWPASGVDHRRITPTPTPCTSAGAGFHAKAGLGAGAVPFPPFPPSRASGAAFPRKHAAASSSGPATQAGRSGSNASCGADQPASVLLALW